MSSRCGVVIAHGQLAEGLLSALGRVAGPPDNLWALSNDGLDATGMTDAVERLLAERAGGQEAFLFSDLELGSCGQTCRRLLASGTVRAVFYGVNLPLLLEFVFLQECPLDQFVATIVEKSRTALGVET